MARLTYDVIGMSCAVCAGKIEKAVNNVSGVKIATVNLAAKQLTVDFDPRLTNISQIRLAVTEAGFSLAENKEEAESAENYSLLRLRNSLIIAWAVAAIVMTLTMTVGNMPLVRWALAVLSAIAICTAGKDIFSKAASLVSRGSADMNTLVALSVSASWLFSTFITAFPDLSASCGLGSHVYFDSATMILAFVLTGRLLEDKAKHSTTAAIRNLMELQPQNATVIDDYGKSRLVGINDITPGMKVIVKPGSRIPVDGVVVAGSSFVDESMLTGEPMPMEKKEDNRVFAGTINEKGALTVSVLVNAQNTLLSRIVASVRDAQGSKAPVQRLGDIISRYFTYFVAAISIITFFSWLLIGGIGMLSTAIVCAVSVLVIACPCALGLATPTAITVGIGKAAEYHILIKDAAALEQICKVTDMVLDKTGTVTEGRPVVISAKISPDASDEELGVMLSAESRSEHPLAPALVASLTDRGINPSMLSSFTPLAGQGVTADWNGNSYWIGSAIMAENNGITADNLHPDEHGGTTIYFGRGKKLLATFVLADMIKESSTLAIALLKRQGLRVYMLTGDNEISAKYVAREVEATEYAANMLPADKDQFIISLQQRGKVVAMAGDGINDTSALARADVSIAMGSGTDIAMETAMVTLPTSDLLALPKAVKLSRLTMRTVRQNMFWAFIYNIIGLPIAAGMFGVVLDPMWASAAMATSSLTVVLNSLRLKLVKL